MKEKATGFEALKGVGAPLKELIDKKANLLVDLEN